MTPEKLADLFWFDGIARDFAKALVCSGRYHELAVSNVVSEVDHSGMMQFAAMCFHVPDGSLFLSFRGTDNTVAGWEEDLCLALMDPVPSQVRAARYADEQIARWVAKDGAQTWSESADALTQAWEVHAGDAQEAPLLRLGGHSKGGNLAFYAAMACEPTHQDHITAAYSFDAPGFSTQRVASEGAQRIKDRCFRFIPEESFFGVLFDDVVEPVIVRSRETGLMQHMPFSWEIDGPELLRSKNPLPMAALSNAAIDKWMSQLGADEVREVYAVLFGVLEYLSADGSVTTMTKDLVTKGPALLGLLPLMDKSVFRTVVSMLQRLVECYSSTLSDGLLREFNRLLGLAQNGSR
jgi:hypothetical protein